MEGTLHSPATARAISAVKAPRPATPSAMTQALAIHSRRPLTASRLTSIPTLAARRVGATPTLTLADRELLLRNWVGSNAAQLQAGHQVGADGADGFEGSGADDHAELGGK